MAKNLAASPNPCYILAIMSFTYKPKKRKRAKTHGFLVRMRTPGGKKALARRRGKGRKRIVVKTRRA